MHSRYYRPVLMVLAAAPLAVGGVVSQQAPRDTVKLPEITAFGSKQELEEIRAEAARQPVLSLFRPEATVPHCRPT